MKKLITDAIHEQNDFFVSTIHRVINETGRERYSGMRLPFRICGRSCKLQADFIKNKKVPFFWGFNRDSVLNPLPTCVSDDNPSKYPVMKAGEYYLYRTKRTKSGAY